MMNFEKLSVPRKDTETKKESSAKEGLFNKIRGGYEKFKNSWGGRFVVATAAFTQVLILNPDLISGEEIDFDNIDQEGIESFMSDPDSFRRESFEKLKEDGVVIDDDINGSIEASVSPKAEDVVMDGTVDKEVDKPKAQSEDLKKWQAAWEQFEQQLAASKTAKKDNGSAQVVGEPGVAGYTRSKIEAISTAEQIVIDKIRNMLINSNKLPSDQELIDLALEAFVLEGREELFEIVGGYIKEHLSEFQDSIHYKQLAELVEIAELPPINYRMAI